MLAFLIRRIGLIIPTFIGVTIAAFAFIRVLPGDPVLLMAGERGVTPERHAALMKQFGFDRPIYEQYFDYLFSAHGGDLGNSLVTKKPVWDEFFTLFPATLELSFCAIIFAVFVGVPAGIFAATRRGSWPDQTIMGTALVGYSMPIFWWGLLLIILFSGTLGWTPVSGRISLLYFFKPVTGFMLIDSLLSGQKGAFSSALSHLILPTIVLGTIPLATAAPEPPLLPAGERVGSHGLLVGPQLSGWVDGTLPSSGRLVLPSVTSPAERNRAPSSVSPVLMCPAALSACCRASRAIRSGSRQFFGRIGSTRLQRK